MKSFADTLAAINGMKTAGVIEEYAVAGAMALLFWTEPVPTLDLDVLVFLPPSPGPLVSLEPIYSWAASRGYSTAAEHVLIEDVPTQFVPSPNSLSDEAISSAATVDYSGVPVRVVRPEYLIALYRDMDSRSRQPQAGAARARPSPELLAQLQHIQVALLAKQRPLRPWERPWDVEP